jgi:hypothetical protein
MTEAIGAHIGPMPGTGRPPSERSQRYTHVHIPLSGYYVPLEGCATT